MATSFSPEPDSPWTGARFDEACHWIGSTLDRLEICPIGDVEPVRHPMKGLV